MSYPHSIALQQEIGPWKAWALHDGFMEVPVDEFIAPRTATQPEVQRALAATDEAGDTLRLPVLALLLQSPDELILIDAGCGRGRQSHPLAGKLVKSLRAAGFSPDAIDKVILTHAHLDHAGGLVDEEGRAVFTNATFYLHEAELAHWWEQSKPGENQDANAQALTEIWEAIRSNVISCEDWQEILPGIQLVPLPGHTPGHCGVRLSHEGHHLLFHLSDLALHQHVYLANPEWDFLLDLDHKEAIETRQETLDTLAENGMRVFATHFEFPGFGYVRKQNDTFVWTPDATAVAKHTPAEVDALRRQQD